MADQATIESRLDSLETGAQGFQQRLVTVEAESAKISQIESDLALLKSELAAVQAKAASAAVKTAPTTASTATETPVTLDDLLQKLDIHGIRFSAEDLHELAYRKSSGDGKLAGDWTSAGHDVTGFPVPKGSATDIS